MPLTWQIDHPNRMMVATAEGILHVEDFEKALDEIDRPPTLSYRKLVDLAQCSSALSKADMLDLSARIRAQASMMTIGALAIVAVSEESDSQARLFDALDNANRPLRIFRDVTAARDWLDTLPPPRPGGTKAEMKEV